MGFEEMKKNLGHAKNNEALYAINERALHNRVSQRRNEHGHVSQHQ